MHPHSQPHTVGQIWQAHFEQAGAAAYQLNSLSFLRRFARSPFIQLIRRYAHLAPGRHVLEAGCGSGKFSVCFALIGGEVTALDISPAILQNVAGLREVVEQEVGPLKLTLLQGDLENLGLEPHQFDLVFNEGVVEHWLDDAERRNLLRHMARMVRPGGTLAIIIPNGYHPRMTYWLHHAPGFLSAPPMVHYSPALLRTDLAAIELNDLFVDGIYAWRTIDYWPTSRFHRLVGGVLQRLIPLPRRLRLQWGVHLIGMGRAP